MPIVNIEESGSPDALQTFAYRFGVGFDILEDAPGRLAAAFDFEAQPSGVAGVGLSAGTEASGALFAGLDAYRSDEAMLAAAFSVSVGRIAGLLIAALTVLKRETADRPALLGLTVGADGRGVAPALFDVSGLNRTAAAVAFDLSAIARVALWQAFNVDSGKTDIAAFLAAFSTGGYGSATFYTAFDAEFGDGAAIVFIDLLDAALCAALGE